MFSVIYRRLVHGDNVIDVEVKSYGKLFVEEVSIYPTSESCSKEGT